MALVVCVFVAGFGAGFAGTPSSKVLTGFKRDYPAATVVTWERESKAYEANFTLDGTKMSALYDAQGKQIEWERAVSTSALPAAVLKSVAVQFPSKKMKDAALITRADGREYYEVEIDGKDHYYDSSGKSVKP